MLGFSLLARAGYGPAKGRNDTPPINPPVNTVAPSISGNAYVGQTLTATTGTWTGSPTSYSYQWKAGGANVGADQNTYVPVSGDVGKTITVTVTASNGGGAGEPTASAATAAVIDIPSNSVAPAITGNAYVGSTLTASSGTWSGGGSLTYTYQWKAAGSDISGATNSTYQPVSGDVGKTISVSVVATNAAGSGSPATSAATAAVIAAPSNSVLPAITGTAKTGQTLSCSTGTWSGGGSPSFAYQWKADATNISGATNSTYQLTDSEIGKAITCAVTATNAAGSATATSTATGTVDAILDGTSPTGAWSFSRLLLKAFAGSAKYTTSTGVSALKDQSGNSRDLVQATSTNQPAVTTAGPNSRACGDWDGSNDRLEGTASSNFITASAGYIIVAGIFDTITLNNTTNAILNHAIVRDSSQVWGLTARNSGSPKSLQASNFDTDRDVAEQAGIVAATAYVMEWKHESGNISVRINGGTWTDVASGDAAALTGTFRLGEVTFDGKIFGAAVWSSVPNQATRDAIVASWKTHIGI